MKASAPAVKISRLVLLDAHAILHRAYHALPDFATAAGEPTGALYGLSTMLLRIVSDLRPDYIIACYDVKGPTHRHEAFKAYKAQRKQAEDDLIAQINRSRDIFTAFGIPIYDRQGFEADDILGTIVEKLKDRAELEIIIASGDMDTMQLIEGERVKVYTLKKGLNDTVMYDEAAVQARYGFGPKMIPDYKGLSGDPSDNIPGVRGIGEKTATTLLGHFGTIEQIYEALAKEPSAVFEKVGLKPRIIQLLKDNQEEAEFSKILATIRRDAPIDFALPEKTFKENIDPAKINAVWTGLEFRTLGARLKQVLEGKPLTASAKTAKISAKAPTDSPQAKASTNQSMFGETVDGVSSERLAKASLMLWLINSNITDPQKEDILNFAQTEDFAVAEKKLEAELDRHQARRVYEVIELPLIPVIERMQTRGIRVDRMVLAKLAEKYHATVRELEQQIWQAAGTEFNINSPKQLGEVLFDKLSLTVKGLKKTAGGARSTKESELEKLRDSHPVVPLIFEYRERQKLLSTYIDAIPPLLDKDDRLHARFVQTGTTTGRMSSQAPNLQNIPVHSELGRPIRQAFVAAPGFKLLALDYSQMELRIAAFLSGDHKLIEIFRNGEDVHRSVASRVFKVPPAEVDPEMRRRAKVINFGIIYGMGVLALKQNLGTSREEAQRFYNDYFAEFSGLAAYLERTRQEAAKRGYSETFFGRRRYFDGLRSKIPYIRAAAERMAINAPIQGTEADVIKLAMVHVAEYLRKGGLEKDVYPLLQVHDELVYEVREEIAEKVSVEIKRLMESVIDPKDTAGVILTVEPAIGDNWGELK